MTENEFEKLWQQAEAEGYGQRMAAEYPVWRQKQQRTMRVVTASLAVVVLVALVFVSQIPHYQDYEKVYCNRVGTTDAQWASLAAELLME